MSADKREAERAESLAHTVNEYLLWLMYETFDPDEILRTASLAVQMTPEDFLDVVNQERERRGFQSH